jgi:para-nitrobenzyl esterase
MDDDNVEVTIANGVLVGEASADRVVRSFKGIPYAQPPVGALRWRPPQPVQAWSSPRNARVFGPRCTQEERPADSLGNFGQEPESEDCLTLNVWSGGRAPERRPVFVWFHGGGFFCGAGSLPIFEGTALARRGIVVVTINYRLGALGFLAHPELSRESEHGVSGNWGILDQIAALQWVHENISAFGGDPQAVTICGQSAGSSSVNILTASPLARGLFQRAIGESGGSMSAPGRPGNGSMLRLAEVEKIGMRAQEHLGARSIADLRAMPADEIVRRWPTDAMSRPWPNIDGWVVPRPLYDIFSDGAQNDVAVLTGANGFEGSTRPAAASWEALQSSLITDFGAENAKLIFDAYRGDGELYDVSRALAGHTIFNWQNWTWARLHARTSRRRTFAYNFLQVPPLPAGRTFDSQASDKLGSYHTAEIPYVFGTLAARPWAWRDADHRLSETMMSYWVNFISTGDPNGSGLTQWPVLTADAPSVLHLGDEIAVGPVLFADKMAVWDKCMARLRAAA